MFPVNGLAIRVPHVLPPSADRAIFWDVPITTIKSWFESTPVRFEPLNGFVISEIMGIPLWLYQDQEEKL